MSLIFTIVLSVLMLVGCAEIAPNEKKNVEMELLEQDIYKFRLSENNRHLMVKVLTEFSELNGDTVFVEKIPFGQNLTYLEINGKERSFAIVEPFVAGEYTVTTTSSSIIRGKHRFLVQERNKLLNYLLISGLKFESR